MKKMLALFLALLMILPFAGCSKEEPKLPLPVELRWGNVTSIETIGKNSEAIVLSMSKPPKPEDTERNVYISAVQYIFDYAPKKLESLSVSSFDQNGNSIISFTIPSDIMTHMREVESSGNWGTVGFAGYYYMNHDAYDDLVARITAANG